MAKRFTDTSIWDKEWFMNLTPKIKCLVRYLFDNCDQAGVWAPNWRLASLHIGEKVCSNDMKEIPGDQWEWLGDKIFLPDFVKFQNGTLSRNSPAHKPIFLLLEKYSLLDRVLNRVSDTLQVKVTVKETVKEEVIVKAIEDCLKIALYDERWKSANKTDSSELATFNNYLERLGKYEMNPLDYKTYFAKLKGKYPDMIKRELTVEQLKAIAKQMDKEAA